MRRDRYINSEVFVEKEAIELAGFCRGPTALKLVLRRRALVPHRGWARYKRRERSTRRTPAQRSFLWRVFNCRPKMSHFVAAAEMRTNQKWGFKFKPKLWLAATQIKSWFSKRWAEQKTAAKAGGDAIAKFLALQGKADAEAASDAEREAAVEAAAAAAAVSSDDGAFGSGLDSGSDSE